MSPAALIAAWVVAAAALALAFALARLARGPTSADRLIGARGAFVCALLLGAAAAVGSGAPGRLDALIAAAFGAIVLGMAVGKFARRGALQPPLADPGAGPDEARS
jgi:multisubunit Na+/H+ antiporter MnhF subunit